MSGVCVPVGQRGDDQSVCTAQVFVAVDEFHICDLDDTSVRLFQEVKPGLFLPLKVQRRSHVQTHLMEIKHNRKYYTTSFYIFQSIPPSTHQLVKDVSLVDVDGDERLVLGPLVSAQLPGRHIDQLVEEVQELLIGCLHDL